MIGHAGELHPRVIAALDLPPRTCAMELDLDAFAPPAPAPRRRSRPSRRCCSTSRWSSPQSVAAADVLAALRTGRGELLESVRLFDVYADASGSAPG